MSDFVTLKEAAGRLSMHERTLRKYIKRGEFPCYRLDPRGGRVLVRWSEVEAWLQSRREQFEIDPDAREMLERLLGTPA